MVQASGTVGEFQGQRQLSTAAINVCGAGLVVPTDVTLPLTDAETLERIRDTAGDIEIVDETTCRLRAERAGNGDGRVYTITYSASDRAGNRTLATTEVRVPHSRGR